MEIIHYLCQILMVSITENSLYPGIPRVYIGNIDCLIYNEIFYGFQLCDFQKLMAFFIY